MVYTSGQIAIDPVTNTVNGTTIEEQTEQVMKNLGAVLATAGSSFEKAVKTLPKGVLVEVEVIAESEL